MNNHPSESYIKSIGGVRILKNEDLTDDEIMVSPRVYEKMRYDLDGKPVGYSPKVDEDFQKMLDEFEEVDYPPFDVNPPRCIIEPINLGPLPRPEPIYLNTNKPTRDEIKKGLRKAITQSKRIYHD